MEKDDMMTPEETRLYDKIVEFHLDEAGVPYPFSLRLAKENNWSLRYTRRILVEYKRFMFLAVTAGHPVGPSDAVDQVWHQHITYTQSYWNHFCKEVIKKQIHHHPGQSHSPSG